MKKKLINKKVNNFELINYINKNCHKVPEVEIIKIEIVCSDRAEGNIILDFVINKLFLKIF